jgi:hypothetical protein
MFLKCTTFLNLTLARCKKRLFIPAVDEAVIPVENARMLQNLGADRRNQLTAQIYHRQHRD